MEAKNKMDGFRFTYSAKEQEELKKIREKYEAREETKLERLRRLDAEVGKKATMYSIIVGVLGALILGSGMSIIMTEFGKWLGLQGLTGIVVGVVFGLVGMLLVALAYPLYQRMIKKERERIAPEIIRLTDELMM